MFDLERSLKQWRLKLIRSGAFNGDDINELESHVRDSVVSHMEEGECEEGAFEKSIKSVGEVDMLEKEYKKIIDFRFWDKLMGLCAGYFLVNGSEAFLGLLMNFDGVPEALANLGYSLVWLVLGVGLYLQWRHFDKIAAFFLFLLSLMHANSIIQMMWFAPEFLTATLLHASIHIGVLVLLLSRSFRYHYSHGQQESGGQPVRVSFSGA